MKYHYKKGIIEKDKKGHPKLYLSLFGLFLAIGYGVFGFLVLSLNGLPLETPDTTAKVVKSLKPGSLGDTIFIPSINIHAPFGNSLKISGNPSSQDVVVNGETFRVDITPSRLRNSSPFFNIKQLQIGDEVFIDKGHIRYAYEISNSKDADKYLTLKSKEKSVKAKAVGIVTWKNGKPRLETY